MPAEFSDRFLDIWGNVGEKFIEFSHMRAARYPSLGMGATPQGRAATRRQATSRIRRIGSR
jgi:hypothetical protein